MSGCQLSPTTGTNADIVFSFTVNNELFSINETTGAVATATVLDREDIAEHQLTIQVCLSLSLSLSLTLQLCVFVATKNRHQMAVLPQTQ